MKIFTPGLPLIIPRYYLGLDNQYLRMEQSEKGYLATWLHVASEQAAIALVLISLAALFLLCFIQCLLFLLLLHFCSAFWCLISVLYMFSQGMKARLEMAKAGFDKRNLDYDDGDKNCQRTSLNCLYITSQVSSQA